MAVKKARRKRSGPSVKAKAKRAVKKVLVGAAVGAVAGAVRGAAQAGTKEMGLRQADTAAPARKAGRTRRTPARRRAS